MHRYGVKLNSGKVVWVLADDAEAHEGMLLFSRKGEHGQVIVAGFSIKEVNHFARPEALGSAET